MTWVFHWNSDASFPDFNSLQSDVYLNPKFPQELKSTLEASLRQAPFIEASVVLTSSGTTGLPKIFLIYKKSFLNAATRVNEALLATSRDRWHCALPMFHVGGLSIGARAVLLNQSPPVVMPFGSWSPLRFVDEVQKTGCTLASLVPTQVADLVRENLKAPESLRAILVGGAALSYELLLKAKSLGWNLLPSYGMTETCAAIALAEKTSGGDFVFSQEKNSFLYRSMPQVLLGHVETVGAATAGEVLTVKCDSMIRAQLNIDTKTWVPVVDGQGFFESSDRVELRSENEFYLLGRRDSFVKVRGEFVSLSTLRKQFASELKCSEDSLLLNVRDDQRLELCLDESLASSLSHENLLNQFRGQGVADLRWEKLHRSWKN